MIQIIREKYNTPESVQRRLVLAGGVNRFGEANYRAVWGWNRLTWIGGKFIDRDETGAVIREVLQLRREPKYPQVNRWHIERWLPPETYGSPRLWYAQTTEREDGKSVPALGPYPVRGEYEHCFTLETQRGDFLQLTATVAERIARVIEFSRLAATSKRRAAVNRREAREDRQYEDWAIDVMDDSVKAFHAQPFVSVV
jgi:hypothetical protein